MMKHETVAGTSARQKIEILDRMQRQWVASVLVNDEISTDEELVEFFKREGCSEALSKKIVAQRSEALNYPIDFIFKQESI